MSSGGDSIRMCGFAAFARYGSAYFDTMKVPRALICCIRSKRRMSVCATGVSWMALALLTTMSMPPKCAAVCVERRLHRRFLAHVDDERQRLAAGLLDLGGGGVDGAFELGMRLDGLGGDGDIGAVARRPCSAIASPMPREPPVMNSVLPLSDIAQPSQLPAAIPR